MSIYQQWLKKRMVREGLGDSGEPVDGFKYNAGDEDRGEDYERTQHELFKAVMSKYPEETMQFLNGIAQRGDQEIAELLRKLGSDKPVQMKEPRHSSEEDEVVPSGADTGYNSEFGGD